MNWWRGSKADSERQASDRNARAARRTINTLPQLVLSSDEDDYQECDTSLLFSTDGQNDPAGSEDDEPEPGPSNNMAEAAAELARQRALPFEDSSFENDPDSWKKEVKIKFDPTDVKYSFNSIESQMKKFGINTQWDKKDALVTTLPQEIIDEVKPILRLSEAEQGDHIYKDLKNEIIQLYGPKPEEAFKKAMALKMTGKPSAFGKQLLHIICPGSKPMEGCHCDKMIFGFWDAQLNSAIRTKLAGLEFNKDTYQEMFKLADQAFLANGGSARPQPSVVAAVTSSSPAPTASDDNPQVAAVSRGGRGGRGGRGRGGRGGRGRGGSAPPQNSSQSSPSSSSSSKPHQKGPQHPDLPSSASWACAQHWKKGRNAPYCSDPLVCKWVSVVAPRTT